MEGEMERKEKVAGGGAEAKEKVAGGGAEGGGQPNVLCVSPEVREGKQSRRETRNISISKSLSTSEHECCQPLISKHK